jgi:hypothetical protein
MDLEKGVTGRTRNSERYALGLEVGGGRCRGEEGHLAVEGARMVWNGLEGGFSCFVGFGLYFQTYYYFNFQFI